MKTSLETPKSDEALADAVRRDEGGAFEELVERYADRVYGFLFRRLGDAEEARDLCQQVFIKAWQARRRYDPGRPYGPWIFTLARREAASSARRRKPLPPLPDETERADFRDPASLLGDREAGEALWAQVRDLLPSAQFTAFWLRTEEGLSIRETARVLRKTEVHTKVLLFRARRRLASALAVSRSSSAATVDSLSPLLQPIPKGETLT